MIAVTPPVESVPAPAELAIVPPLIVTALVTVALLIMSSVFAPTAIVPVPAARELPSARLGELVMRELKRIDKVAYVRFASVYRSFEDVDEFRQLIRDI